MMESHDVDSNERFLFKEDPDCCVPTGLAHNVYRIKYAVFWLAVGLHGPLVFSVCHSGMNNLHSLYLLYTSPQHRSKVLHRLFIMATSVC